MKPEYQTLAVLVTTLITAYGFYLNLKAKAIEQATKINTLELKNEFLEKTVKDHAHRLDDHEVQNKTLVAMDERMKNLTDDVKELKEMIKEKG